MAYTKHIKSFNQEIGGSVITSTVQQLDAYIGQIKNWMMQIDSRWSCTEIPSTFIYEPLELEVPITIRKLIWNNCNDTELLLYCSVYTGGGGKLMMVLKYHIMHQNTSPVETDEYSGPLHYVVGDNWFVMHTMGNGTGPPDSGNLRTYAIGALIGDDGITRCFWQDGSSTGMYKNGIREYPLEIGVTNGNMYIDGYLYDGSSTLTTKISNGVCVASANKGVEYTIDGKLYYTIPVKGTNGYHTLLLS